MTPPDLTPPGATPPGAMPPGAAPTPDPAPVRRLRRSRSDRVGAGVAGGLGEYFGVYPVLFRVLFATAAFFGGAGLLAYLLAWAAIPEEGTEHASIDGWVASLRRRRVPIWVVAIGAALLLWIVAFSWWAPGPFVPVVVTVLLLVAVFGRRGRRDGADPAFSPDYPQQAAPSDAPGTAPVDLTKGPATTGPQWPHETRGWLAESRAASRARSRRAFPVKITTLLVLAATLLTLGLVDAAQGVLLPIYFWCALGIIGAGLVIGMALRRTPWSLVILLVPAVLGTIAFAGSHASLHDGIGNRRWTPTTTINSNYKVAFGSSILDLRSLHGLTAPRTVRIDQAAGRVQIIAPEGMALTVHANVHIGVVTVDGQDVQDSERGVGINSTIEPFATASGVPLVVDVHLADGRLDISRQ